MTKMTWALLHLQVVTVKMTTTVTTAFHSAAGGIGVTYTKTKKQATTSMAVTYSAGALSLSLTALDETNWCRYAAVAGNPTTITAAGDKRKQQLVQHM